MPHAGSRFRNDDVPYSYGEDDYEAGGLTGWGWFGVAMLVLVILATLAVAAATLGIVDEYKKKWKGGSGSDDYHHLQSTMSELEKRFHVLNDKMDWVKDDLRELDDIEEKLYWIGKHMKKRKYYGGDETYYSETESQSESSRESGDDDDWKHKRKRTKPICRIPKGYQLRFCDPYDGTQGIYDPSDFCPYFFFADPSVPFVGDDGSITQNFEKGFVKIDSMPFKLTVPQSPAGGIDHVKYLNYQSDTKFVGPEESLRYDVKTSCETDVGNVPFPPDLITDADRDFRLAACAVNGIDFTTLIVVDWFLTGPKDGELGSKACLYERLPFLQNCTDPNQPECYRAFTSVNVTGSRHKNDKEYLTIEYDRWAGEIRWYDKGELACKVDNLGTPNPGFKIILDHGGNNKIVDVDQFSFGFGTFTLLDMVDPLNPDSETGLVKLSNLPNFYVLPCEDCFFDLQSEESNRLFGQGARMMMWQSQVSIGDAPKKHSFIPEFSETVTTTTHQTTYIFNPIERLRGAKGV